MKKKLFAVYYIGKLGLAMQPTKANTPEEAKAKFLKKNPKIKQGLLGEDCEEIEATHERFAFFKNHAI